MKNLLITLLVLFSLTANAQQRGQRTAKDANKCIYTTIVEKEKVTVTTINKCNKTKTIKVYTKEEWKAILEKRKKRARERRGGKN
tara:strand:- start:312 stop:566 length:255 start_codon:yes stop_codon:yes gene_type:complete